MESIYVFQFKSAMLEHHFDPLVFALRSVIVFGWLRWVQEHLLQPLPFFADVREVVESGSVFSALCKKVNKSIYPLTNNNIL